LESVVGASPYKIGLIGVGKIARDQHLPALHADDRFELVATADPVARWSGVPGFASLEAMLREGPRMDAVSICTPPRGRSALVAQAVEAGLHVMIEKPPAPTLSEIAAMRSLATDRGRTLFAAWHSREAGAVAPAKKWLSGRQVDGFEIRWKEDIRRWHLGQDWILAAGGFGVFDPAINALSIATAILPDRLVVSDARLDVPENRESPIAADVVLHSGGAEGRMMADFLEADAPEWTIEVMAPDGTLTISDGGRSLELPGSRSSFQDDEYRRLYARFAGLIERGESDVDDEPSRLVFDMLVVGTRKAVADFHW
jgi:D-galactose 1-dehydrogenase/L-arabinose 1- dehydrogenase